MENNISLLSDIHSESGIIATLFYHPEFIVKVDYLKPDHFYSMENKCIYWAIQELYKSGINNYDAMNITTMLNSNYAVKRKIDEYSISSIQEYISSAAYVSRSTFDEFELLVKNVISMAFRRKLNNVSIDIQGRCFNQDLTVGDLNKFAIDSVTGASEDFMQTETVVPFGDLVDDFMQQLMQENSGGIPSKYPILSEYFTYQPGEVYMIKARMKEGKSVFLMNELVHKMKNGVPVLYVDTEMSDFLFNKRLMAHLTGIDLYYFNNYWKEYPKMSEEWKEKIFEANRFLKTHHLVHKYATQITDDELYTLFKIQKSKFGVEFGVFDYLKSNETSTSDNYNILGQKCDFLKNNIAGELKIPILTAAQLNRELKVADSDKLERYVTTSCTWKPKLAEEVQKDGLKCGNYRLTVDVNRIGKSTCGENDYMDFYFKTETSTIMQCKQHRADENDVGLNGERGEGINAFSGQKN